jgi:recombination associated protein RdgC
MWFKNLRLYRFTEPFTATAEELHQALSNQGFEPCGSLDQSRYGWVPPLGRHGREYIHTANGYIMISAKRQEKILPGAVVNEALEEKLIQINEEEGRSPGRKERQDLKDEIIFSLMPKAFTKSSVDFAYIAPQEGMLVVNAASAKRAENLISALREAVGSLPLIPVAPKNLPTQMMTLWLTSAEPPQGFALGEECELQAGTDGRIIRCKNVDLTADEVRSHLESGMFVKRLALTWNDAIHFVVDDELGIKRLKFEDTILGKADDQVTDSAAEQFDVEFSVMTLELSAFIRNLLDAFGGEQSY